MGAEGKAAVDAGALIVELLISGELQTWVDTYALEVTTVRPADDASKDAALGELGGREWAYILDLRDLSIVWKAFGSYGGGGGTDSSAKQGLDELGRLLAP